MRVRISQFAIYAYAAVLCQGNCLAQGGPPPETPAKPTVAAPELKWRQLFDGKSLTNWKATEYARGGKVHIDPQFKGDSAAILVDAGGSLSGFNWSGSAVPKTNYEISLEAMKIKGDDFMCGLTVPVGDSFISLICGGWGGYLTGVSSLDTMDASENETQTSIEYKPDRWYHIRMRVTPKRIQAWLDDKRIINVDISQRKVSLRIGEIEKSVPIGISTYHTSSAFRAIKVRDLTEVEQKE